MKKEEYEESYGFIYINDEGHRYLCKNLHGLKIITKKYLHIFRICVIFKTTKDIMTCACLYLLVFIVMVSFFLNIVVGCVIMKNMKTKHLIILIGTVLLDQFTKFLITMNFDLYDSIEVIPGFFNLTYVQNTGAAWSILEGNMVFFYLITIVALFLMVGFYKSNESNELSKWGIVLMIGGTLGNFLDRLRLQYVVDFFDFNIFGYDFPVFNIADSFLCIGVAVLLVAFILEEVSKK